MLLDWFLKVNITSSGSSSATRRDPTSLIWTPQKEFEDTDQGVWYDPSDLSSMFQDYEGTIPVRDNGDPIGLILDKSGNNNHARQINPELRPIYQIVGNVRTMYFNGVDSLLETNVIDLLDESMVVTMGYINSQNPNKLIGWASYNKVSSDISEYVGLIATQRIMRRDSNRIDLRVNGLVVDSQTLYDGTDKLISDNTLKLGSYSESSKVIDGNICGVITHRRFEELPDANIEALEKYLASKTKIALT